MVSKLLKLSTINGNVVVKNGSVPWATLFGPRIGRMIDEGKILRSDLSRYPNYIGFPPVFCSHYQSALFKFPPFVRDVDKDQG